MNRCMRVSYTPHPEIVDLADGFVASLIVSGEKPNEVWQPLVVSSDDLACDSSSDSSSSSSNTAGNLAGEETSEIQELFSAVVGANTSPFKLSMVIRSSPPRDSYNKAASIYPYDTKYDIGHVWEKYPAARERNLWLIDRLGKAITRRRQYLRYREEHRGKLSGTCKRSENEPESQRDLPQADTASRPEHPPPRDIFGSMAPSTLAPTTATTYVANEPVQVENFSDGGGSQTSYATTAVSEDASNNISIPPPPEKSTDGMRFEYGKPFECPYCYTIQIVANRSAWKYVDGSIILLLSRIVLIIYPENMSSMTSSLIFALSSSVLLRCSPVATNGLITSFRSTGRNGSATTVSISLSTPRHPSRTT
jgi:hypothetical protein